MSKTRKNLIYSAVIAVIILLTFVAVTFMTAPQENSVISEVRNEQSVLNTVTVPSSDSAYAEFDALTSLGGPGTVGSIITNNTPGVQSPAYPITAANSVNGSTGLIDALQTNGTYYLMNDVIIDNAVNNASQKGSFGGVIYGNGHTVTIKLTSRSIFESDDYGTFGFLVKKLNGGTIRDVNIVIECDSVFFGKN